MGEMRNDSALMDATAPRQNTIILFLDYHIGEFNFIFPLLLDLLDDSRNRIYLLSTKREILDAVQKDPLLGKWLRHPNLHVWRFYCRGTFTNRVLRKVCLTTRSLPLWRSCAKMFATLITLLARRRGPVYVGMQLECGLRPYVRSGLHFFTYPHATETLYLPPEQAGAFVPPQAPHLLNADLPLLCYFNRSRSYFVERGFVPASMVECGVSAIANLYKRMLADAVKNGRRNRIAVFLCFPQGEWLEFSRWAQKTGDLMRAIRAVFPDDEIYATRHPNTIPDPRVKDHLDELSRTCLVEYSELTQHSLIASSDIVIGFGTSAFFPAVVRDGVYCCYFNAVSDSPDHRRELVSGRWVVNHYEEFATCVDSSEEFLAWLRRVRAGEDLKPTSRILSASLSDAGESAQLLEKIRLAANGQA